MSHVLTLDNLVPSALAEGPAPGVSKRYQFLSTKDVVQQFMDSGLILADSKETRAMNDKRRGFQRHQIFMDFPWDTGGQAVGDHKMQLRIINSHCQSAAFTIFLGVHVLVCSNGMVIPSGEQQAIIHMRHIRSKLDAQEIFQLGQDRAWKAETLIQKMREREMTFEEQTAFAEAAIGMRWRKGIKGHGFLPTDLILNPRPEQKEPTLWNTLNTIQESVIKGFGYTDEKRPKPKDRRTRGIVNMRKDIGINSELWSYAETLVS